MSFDSQSSGEGNLSRVPRQSDFTRKYHDDDSGSDIHDSGIMDTKIKITDRKPSGDSGNLNASKVAGGSAAKVVSAATSASALPGSKSKQGLFPSGTNVSPFIRNMLKKKFKSVDRKREEELLGEFSEAKKLQYLAATSHFSMEEVEGMALMFQALTKDCDPPNLMNRTLFQESFRINFGITDSLMLDQIFYFFDADREGTISETEWIKNLGIILRGSLDEHCNYCFSVYDLNGDKSLGRTETRALIQHCLGRQVHSEDVEIAREVAELVFRKLDPTGSGRITPQSFRKAVQSDPLLLQSLGHCLPSGEKTETFMNMVTENPKKYAASYSLPNFSSYSYERERYDGPRASIHSIIQRRRQSQPRISRPKQTVKIIS